MIDERFEYDFMRLLQTILNIFPKTEEMIKDTAYQILTDAYYRGYNNAMRDYNVNETT